MRHIIVLALAFMGLATLGALRNADAADTAAKPPELHVYPEDKSDKGPTYRIRMKAIAKGEHVLTLDRGEGKPGIELLASSTDGHVVEFGGALAAGRHDAIVRLKNDADGQPYTLVLAHLTRGGVVAWSAVVTLALLIGVVALASMDHTTGPGLQRISLLRAFFIDPDSNSYSLSKAQLYLWLIATMFGYIYLSLSRYFVQQRLEWPDLQDGSPGMLLGPAGLAVGTTVLSTGVRRLMGGKGAGDTEPRLADLVSSGGVVTPERVQFLLWTLVAVVSYVGLTLAVDPAGLASLPVTPHNLLTLSALSAGGYLAGQIARGPGPKIASIKATVASSNAAQLDLEIDGSALATRGAAFYLAPVPAAPPPAPAGTPGTVDNAAPIQPQWRPGSVIDVGSGFATHLSLSLIASAAAGSWKAGDTWRFSIVNPDGERATFDLKVS